jgi:hypothetical protein
VSAPHLSLRGPPSSGELTRHGPASSWGCAGNRHARRPANRAAGRPPAGPARGRREPASSSSPWPAADGTSRSASMPSRTRSGWPPIRCRTTPLGTGTSPWRCWRTPTCPPPAPPRQRGSAAGNEQLIALTVPELRRLLNTLIRTPGPDLDHAADWSWWRRRRQARPTPPTTEPADKRRDKCRCSIYPEWMASQLQDGSVLGRWSIGWSAFAGGQVGAGAPVWNTRQ